MKSPNSITSSCLLGTDMQQSALQTLAPLAHHHAYSPYGYCPDLQSLLAFNGERPDVLTRHYHLGNGYRAFNLVLMRFNSPDSLSPFSGGGLNTYAYCGGDPVNRRDPTGHKFWSRLGNRLRALTSRRRPRQAQAQAAAQAPAQAQAQAPAPHVESSIAQAVPQSSSLYSATKVGNQITRIHGHAYFTYNFPPLPGVPSLKNLAASHISYFHFDKAKLYGQIPLSLHQEVTGRRNFTWREWGYLEPEADVPTPENFSRIQMKIRENVNTMLSEQGRGAETQMPQQVQLYAGGGTAYPIVWMHTYFEGRKVVPRRI